MINIALSDVTVIFVKFGVLVVLFPYGFIIATLASTRQDKTSSYLLRYYNLAFCKNMKQETM